jgi:hypothetical protein
MNKIDGMELFAAARGNMRVVLGVIFALFVICFVAIIVEETFLGGRRRRKAEKAARERALAGETAGPSTATPAPQNSSTPRHPQ